MTRFQAPYMALEINYARYAQSTVVDNHATGGFLFHFPVRNGLDVTLETLFLTDNYTSDSAPSAANSGSQFAIGLRWRPVYLWEFDARAYHQTENNGAGSANGEAADVLYAFTRTLSGQVEYSHSSYQGNTYLMGLRFYF